MLAVAMSQPSAELAAYAATMPNGHGCPPSLVSNDPSSLATCGLSVRASTRFSSISGLIPQPTRRNSLRIARSSNTTLVLLCSPSVTRAAAAVGSTAPGSLMNRASPITAEESISDNSRRAESAW